MQVESRYCPTTSCLGVHRIEVAVHPNRSTLRALAAAGVGALLLVAAPAAVAAPDLAGTWESASVKNGGAGYTLVVKAADSDPVNAYDVVVRYRPAGAQADKRVKAGMTQKGNKVFLLLNGQGGLADAGNSTIMKGTLGQDGSLFFPTCLKQLPAVGKGKAAAVCLFQESAS